MMLAMMVLALSLTACGGDDDDDVINDSASLVGTWVCTVADLGEWEPYLVESTKPGDITRFKSDHTYESEGNNNDRGRWSLSGSKLTLISDDSSVQVPITYTVTELSSTTLSVSLSDEWGTFYFSFRRQSN